MNKLSQLASLLLTSLAMQAAGIDQPSSAKPVALTNSRLRIIPPRAVRAAKTLVAPVIPPLPGAVTETISVPLPTGGMQTFQRPVRSVKPMSMAAGIEDTNAPTTPSGLTAQVMRIPREVKLDWDYTIVADEAVFVVAASTNFTSWTVVTNVPQAAHTTLKLPIDRTEPSRFFKPGTMWKE